MADPPLLPAHPSHQLTLNFAENNLEKINFLTHPSVGLSTVWIVGVDDEDEDGQSASSASSGASIAPIDLKTFLFVKESSSQIGSLNGWADNCNLALAATVVEESSQESV